MQGSVQLSNQLAQGSHPAPPPQHSVQQGSFSLATQEMTRCCKAPKVSPGVGDRMHWKRSSALCTEAAAEALSPLGARGPSCSEVPWVRKADGAPSAGYHCPAEEPAPRGSVVLELSLLATMGIPAMLKALAAQLRDQRCSGQLRLFSTLGRVLVTGPRTQRNIFLLLTCE